MQYEKAAGLKGNLEVDINFMFRVPLWPVKICDSHPIGAWQAKEILVLDEHELAAGKLAALLARRQARDLFDSHQILSRADLDFNHLRLGFVTYGAMNRKDWRKVSLEDVNFNKMDLAKQLIPTLSLNAPKLQVESTEYGARLVIECREGLTKLLPFWDSERAFLDLLLDRGVIDPALLTSDESLQRRIQHQPLLKWKAFNVLHHKPR